MRQLGEPYEQHTDESLAADLARWRHDPNCVGELGELLFIELARVAPDEEQRFEGLFQDHRKAWQAWFAQARVELPPGVKKSDYDGKVNVIVSRSGSVYIGGDFDLRDEKTWPEGSRLDGTTLFFALPPDGVLVFDSFKGLRKKLSQCGLHIFLNIKQQQLFGLQTM